MHITSLQAGCGNSYLTAALACAIEDTRSIQWCREKKVGTNFLQNNPLQRYFSTCPDNAFQKVPSGYQPFTLAQRAGQSLSLIKLVLRHKSHCILIFGMHISFCVSPAISSARFFLNLSTWLYRGPSEERAEAAWRRVWSQPVWCGLHQCPHLCPPAFGQRVPTPEPPARCVHDECSIRLLHGPLFQSEIPGKSASQEKSVLKRRFSHDHKH